MDPRRLLILAAGLLALAGCAGPGAVGAASATPPARSLAPAAPLRVTPALAVRPSEAGLVAPPVLSANALGRGASGARARRAAAARVRTALPRPGPAAIAAANLAARQLSRPDRFVGGVQVFAYAPGRIYEVWTAPLRVTTLTLGPAETLVSEAAGDTVRWEIGETTSGAGPEQRAHVMIKPLRRGLETNLTLATSRRIYLITVRSGAPSTFNREVAWDAGPTPPAAQTPRPPPAAPALPAPADAARLDARYRIEPAGRPPAWTPRAVMTDGIRTYLEFPPQVTSAEAPALFIAGPDGLQLVNYRQQAGLWVVDQVIERGELRLGDHRPQVVRIVRAQGERR